MCQALHRLACLTMRHASFPLEFKFSTWAKNAIEVNTAHSLQSHRSLCIAPDTFGSIRVFVFANNWICFRCAHTITLPFVFTKKIYIKKIPWRWIMQYYIYIYIYTHATFSSVELKRWYFEGCLNCFCQNTHTHTHTHTHTRLEKMRLSEWHSLF